jgi:hypothetical protein
LNLNSFTEVAVKYPALGDATMFDKLVSWCRSVAKEKLSVTIRKQVMAIITAHEQREKAEEKVMSLCLSLCNLYLFDLSCVCVADHPNKW